MKTTIKTIFAVVLAAIALGPVSATTYSCTRAFECDVRLSSRHPDSGQIHFAVLRPPHATLNGGSVYQFIGVWQQEPSHRPQRENGATVRASDLIPHLLSGALLGRPDPLGSCLLETSPRDAPTPPRIRCVRRSGGVSVPQIYCAPFPSHRPTCIRADRVPNSRAKASSPFAGPEPT